MRLHSGCFSTGHVAQDWSGCPVEKRCQKHFIYSTPKGCIQNQSQEIAGIKRLLDVKLLFLNRITPRWVPPSRAVFTVGRNASVHVYPDRSRWLFKCLFCAHLGKQPCSHLHSLSMFFRRWCKKKKITIHQMITFERIASMVCLGTITTKSI